MIDKFNNIFYLQMPTNINSLINTIGLILRHYNKDTSISIDDIKNKSRELFLLDFHVFCRTGDETFKKYKGYWIKRMSRIMNIYRLYIEDMTRMFGIDGIQTFESDIDYTIHKIFGIKINVEVPQVFRERIYDHDYITKYVTDGEDDIFFDIRCAIAADEIEKYIPRVYGCRLQKFDSVCNRAGVNLVLPIKVKQCLEAIWTADRDNAKQFLHDTMWTYFDDSAIENLFRYLRIHRNKEVYHYGILSNNNYINNILNNDQYTTAVHYSNLDYCKHYFNEFIEECYACS